MSNKKIRLPHNKIIIHNLTFKGVEQKPYLFNFDQRGVVCAQPGDMIVTHHSIDKDFLIYLESLGWNFDNVKKISFEYCKSEHSTIFDSKELTSLIKKSNFDFIDTYQLTDFEKSFSKKTKLPLTSKNIYIAKKYGIKSGFRKLANRLNISIVKGEVCSCDEGKILLAIENLLKEGVKNIAIKLDESAGGLGTTLLDSKHFLSLTKIEKIKFIGKAISKFDQFSPESGAVIEEWVEKIKVSPASIVNINNNTSIEVCMIHDQILSGKSKSYFGSSFPSLMNDKLILQVKNISILFAKALKAEGFQGYFGVDFILFGSKIYPVELNMRKMGTFYPAYIFGHLGRPNKCFYSRSINLELTKSRDFNFIKRRLKPVLYPINRRKRGVIITYIGALKISGKVDIMCIDGSHRKTRRLYKEVVKVLK